MLFFSIARKNHSHLQKAMVFTEKGGFEPPDPGLAGQLLSREPDSASLAPLQFYRRERDSNPRRLSPQQFSRLPPSTTRTSLQYNINRITILQIDGNCVNHQSCIGIKQHYCIPKLVCCLSRARLFRQILSSAIFKAWESLGISETN